MQGQAGDVVVPFTQNRRRLCVKEEKQESEEEEEEGATLARSVPASE